MATPTRAKSSTGPARTGSRGVEEPTPLAEAKLAAPRQRRNIVERPRIVRMLNDSEGAALTLVAAPAGYGKSTAVREWCASRRTAFAWVTLDAGDNDLVRLWTYVATAVDRVREGLGRRALKRLGVAGAPIEIAVDELMNGTAALFLAALWLRSVEDPGRAVTAFGGEHRFVVEYLSREALGTLNDETRSFLLRAAVLGRFTPELCDGVLGRSDAASVLAELERSNLFVIRLEHGGWWRVHSLFAEFAGFELASVDPGAAVGLHRRAAAWFRSRGMAAETIEHAVAAGDQELVVQILVEDHLQLLRSGRARTLLRWMRTLSGQQLVEHPELAVVAATAAATVGHATIEQRRFLALARRAQAERPESATPYVQAVAGMVRAITVDSDVGQAIADGRHAAEVALASADEVLVAALAGYARALYFGGEFDEAWAAASRAVEHPGAERTSVTRSRLCTTRGCSPFSPGSAVSAGVLKRQRRRYGQLARRLASSPTAGESRRLPRKPSASSNTRTRAPAGATSSNHRARRSSRCCGS